jgi:hypothetical protein
MSSTTHKKGTRYQGVSIGSRDLNGFNFINWIKDPPSQQDSAALKLNPKVVVTG